MPNRLDFIRSLLALPAGAAIAITGGSAPGVPEVTGTNQISLRGSIVPHRFARVAIDACHSNITHARVQYSADGLTWMDGEQVEITGANTVHTIEDAPELTVTIGYIEDA